MRYCAFVLLLCGGLVHGDVLNFVRTIKNQLNFNNYYNQDKERALLEEKCKSNGGPETFQNLLSAKVELEYCLNGAFGYGNLSKVFELSQSAEGALLEYVDEYCNAMTSIKDCVKNAAAIFQNCFNEKEKLSLKFVVNVFDSLANFTCYKDGDCVIFFIAEGGPECVLDKNDELKKCAIDIMRGIDLNDVRLSTMPLLINYTTVCDDFSKLQSCIVKNLEQCEDVTPANVIGSLFTFILRNYSC